MSAGYTTTKYHRLSHHLGGWKSEIRTPAWWGSGESSLPSWQVTALTVLSHGEEKEGSSWVSPLNVVQSLSCVQLFATHGQQHTQASLSFAISWRCAILTEMSLSQWCYPTISSSVIPFSSCLQSFPASKSFPMSLLIASGAQNIGISASASLPPMNIED